MQLSRAQSRALGQLIINNIEGNYSFRTPYPQWAEEKLRNIADRFLGYSFKKEDLRIAEIFRYLPYTHEENQKKLANQLLAWHLIGALDNRELLNPEINKRGELLKRLKKMED